MKNFIIFYFQMKNLDKNNILCYINYLKILQRLKDMQVLYLKILLMKFNKEKNKLIKLEKIHKKMILIFNLDLKNFL